MAAPSRRFALPGAIMGDLRLAVRSLLKAKLFTAVAVTTLAIGIGSTTAVFSLFSAIALKPLPFPEPTRLVDVEEWSATELSAGSAVGVSAPTLNDLAAGVKSLEAIASYLEVPTNVSGSESPERVSGALVSGNFFRVLGVNPAIGRAIDASDDRASAPPVVVINNRLFVRRFGGDRSILGQSIRINGMPHTIIGVMPATVMLPEFAELWTPMQQSYHVTDRASRDLGVIGRLRGGYSVAAADLELKTLGSAIAKDHPDTQAGWTTRVRPLRQALGGEEVGIFGFLLAAVLVLLLIVCANVASMMLARGAARRKDIAVRLALGARRSTIIWHLLAESLCLAIAGGVLGVLAASWGVDLMLASLQTNIPGWLRPTMDFRVMAFAVAASMAAAIAFGLAPALRSSRGDVHEDIKAGGPANIGGRRALLRGSLVVVQLALSLVLLAAAGVLMASVTRISARQIGLSDRDVVQARFEMLGSRTPEQNVATVKALVDRLSQIAGARTASIIGTGFIAGFGAQDQKIRAEGIVAVPDGVSPRFYFAITPKYFETVRLQLTQGRKFTDADARGTVPVVIINQTMGRRLWPAGNPTGHRIRLGNADSLPWRTIVGVVNDVGSNERIANAAYVPFAQAPQSAATIMVGSTGEPSALINPIREAARGVDADLPLVDLMTAEQDHARHYWPYRAYALMLTAVGAVALLLAGIGLYGVIAYAVEQRSREVGLRIALGANRNDVLRLVTRQGFVLVIIGVVFGVLGAIVVLPVMKSIPLLFGASPLDSLVFAAVTAILVLVALIASYIPARRATRVDPMIAMRSE
jgi:putative ABC transport system permease protein